MSSLQGGAMGGVDDLYREVILEHFKSPRNKGKLAHPTAQADGVNPLCGDQISISALIENGVVKDIKFDGQGCAISQSTASMMTAAIKGKTLADAKAFTKFFKDLFGVKDATIAEGKKFSPEDLGDLEALEGVKKYPVRIKCALLSWNTFLESLNNFEK